MDSGRESGEGNCASAQICSARAQRATELTVVPLEHVAPASLAASCRPPDHGGNRDPVFVPLQHQAHKTSVLVSTPFICLVPLFMLFCPPLLVSSFSALVPAAASCTSCPLQLSPFLLHFSRRESSGETRGDLDPAVETMGTHAFMRRMSVSQDGGEAAVLSLGVAG